ncbi:MAG: nitroreductase [Lactobacillus sp.]|jgi:nitroreductase|nr:nitroreductase [Lactobacillus sp.]MCH3906348.1 nitroreductase [Lactobacillus sp.]MCH3990079.1 nitroreductase [Lactobacillus sp.]MCH4069207.1 nitroreductase [Lactobacillus sp.]MCI1303509.1 nitroreductase [Lactobacillus sp.]
MEFLETVNNRHSVRDFSDRLVKRADLEDIVQTAGKAPSWANDQPWKVVIATGQTLAEIKKNHLASSMNGRMENSEFPSLHRASMGRQGQSNLRIWSSGIHKFLGANVNDMYDDSANLFNAPAIAYLLLPADLSAWTTYDLGAFGQTLMLAAKDKGIDSIPAEEFVLNPTALHQILGIDNDYVIGMGIGLGYAKDAKINDFRSKRMDLTKFLTIKD